MKKLILLFLVLSFGLTACAEERPSQREVTLEVEEEEVIVVEEEIEEEEEKLCGEEGTWNDSLGDSRKYLSPTEELYARKVYLMEEWGIEFEIPGQSSEYHAYTEGNTIIFSLAQNIECTGVGDAMDPYFKYLPEVSDEISIEAETMQFTNFAAAVYREDYLGSTEIVTYEFEINEQWFNAGYIDKKDTSDEELMIGILESLEVITESTE
jgi:hypothetical protein